MPSSTPRNRTCSKTQRFYQQNHKREHDQSDISAHKKHKLPKDKREFEYLTLDSMEIITRGEVIPFESDSDTIDRINVLASTESSKLFCPSYKKTKSKRKQGRPRKQLTDVCEGVLEVGNLQQYETVTDQRNTCHASKTSNPHFARTNAG